MTIPQTLQEYFLTPPPGGRYEHLYIVGGSLGGGLGSLLGYGAQVGRGVRGMCKQRESWVQLRQLQACTQHQTVFMRPYLPKDTNSLWRAPL